MSNALPLDSMLAAFVLNYCCSICNMRSVKQ